MSENETRKITVSKENPRFQEYDREVTVELWHNQHQTSVLRLSPVEARNLLDELSLYFNEKGAY